MIQEVKTKKDSLTNLSNYLSKRLKNTLNKISEKNKSQIFEIRIRLNQPLSIRSRQGISFVLEDGELSSRLNNSSVIISKYDIEESFNKICEYSVYSRQEEIRNGFITINGGHRIGICGTAIKKDNLITSIKNVSSLNIRIAHEMLGISDDLFKSISDNDLGILIVGPPSCGKTTLLRDISRKLSVEWKKCVTIVDERGEIAATYNGTPENNIGFCDVMNGYPKGEGILQAIRTLSPEIIVCDEIGCKADTDAIEQGLNAGVHLIASIHADSIESLLMRPQAKKLLNSGAFKKIVLLQNSKNPGIIKQIVGVDSFAFKSSRFHYDNSMQYCYRGGGVTRSFS